MEEKDAVWSPSRRRMSPSCAVVHCSHCEPTELGWYGFMLSFGRLHDHKDL